jgi:hypothetical protein
MMDISSTCFDALQSAVLSHQYHEDVGKACRCGAEAAPYRCEECFDPHAPRHSCVVVILDETSVPKYCTQVFS